MTIIVLLSQRKLPDHPKMNFNVGRLVTAGKKNSKMYVPSIYTIYLVKFSWSLSPSLSLSPLPPCRVDRLSAQDVISIRKVLDHVYNKMEPKATSEARKNGEEVFEMICNNQVNI